jgi:ribulose-phosphate 3-epimerase
VSLAEWTRNVTLEPSIYAADFACLGDQLRSLLDAGATVFHVDVGDGHFIPEITMGPIVLESLANLVHDRGGFFDCHLMVERPIRLLEQLRAAGADSVTFHVEAADEPAATIAHARQLGLGVGVAFNPETSVEQAVAAADGADFVLCMSIHPGLSGQEFQPDALERMLQLRRLLAQDVAIQVDGGVKLSIVPAVREAGANLLVVGSGVFWDDDPATAYRVLAGAAAAAAV